MQTKIGASLLPSHTIRPITYHFAHESCMMNVLTGFIGPWWWFLLGQAKVSPLLQRSRSRSDVEVDLRNRLRLEYCRWWWLLFAPNKVCFLYQTILQFIAFLEYDDFWQPCFMHDEGFWRSILDQQYCTFSSDSHSWLWQFFVPSLSHNGPKSWCHCSVFGKQVAFVQWRCFYRFYDSLNDDDGWGQLVEVLHVDGSPDIPW